MRHLRGLLGDLGLTPTVLPMVDHDTTALDRIGRVVDALPAVAVSPLCTIATSDHDLSVMIILHETPDTLKEKPKKLQTATTRKRNFKL